jgi:hypothetical protein
MASALGYFGTEMPSDTPSGCLPVQWVGAETRA